MTDIKPRIMDGVGWCDRGCPQGKSRMPNIKTCPVHCKIDGKKRRRDQVCPYHAPPRQHKQLAGSCESDGRDPEISKLESILEEASYQIAIRDHDIRRMAVELDAWRAGRLWKWCDEYRYNLKNKAATCKTPADESGIREVVDALMEEVTP